MRTIPETVKQIDVYTIGRVKEFHATDFTWKTNDYMDGDELESFMEASNFVPHATKAGRWNRASKLKGMSQEDVSELSYHLILTDANGIYIPQIFAEQNESIIENWLKNNPSFRGDVESLSDPEGEWYWDAWMLVMDNFEYPKGHEYYGYSLSQQGDLWAIDHALIGEWEEANETEFNYDF